LDRLLFTSGKKPLPLPLGHGLVVKGVFVPHEKITTPRRMNIAMAYHGHA
jgi:hypothetical protein